MDTLQAVDDSTIDLYERFGLDADSIPPAKRRKIFMEEVTELLESSARLEFYKATGENAHDLADEAADVLVTVLGLLHSHGVTVEMYRAAIARVTVKNDAKTAETHTLVNGKITRKQVTP